MKKFIVYLFTVIITLVSVPVMATLVHLDLLTDIFPSETSFQLIFNPGGANTPLPFDSANPNDPPFADGFVTAGDLTAPNMLYQFDWNVGPGSYVFTIFDTFGDGLTVVSGSYDLSVDDVLIRTGADFGASEATAFSVPEPGIMLLLGSGLLGLGVFRKRFKK